MAQRIRYLLLGKALNAFGDNITDTRAIVSALYKVVPYVWYMAFATFPAGILEIGYWICASERQMARLRIAYLKADLSQEIGAFDTDLTSGKIISGISIHTSIIQAAIGEKLGAWQLSGILIAATCSWKVALLNFLVVPMILAMGAPLLSSAHAAIRFLLSESALESFRNNKSEKLRWPTFQNHTDHSYT